MKNILSMSIRTHLLILFAIMMVAPFGIIVHSSLTQRDYQENEAKFLTSRLSDQVASEISGFSASTELLLSTLSKLEIVQKRKVHAVHNLLADIIKQYPSYSNLLLLDKSGNLWASAIPFTKSLSYAERRHVKNALLTGKFSSSEFTIGKLIGKPIFAFALPITDDSGQVNGVAIAAFDLANFTRILKGLKYEKDTTIVLVDHHGTILYNALYPDLIGKAERNDLFARMAAGPDQSSFNAVGSIGTYRIISYRKLKLAHEQTPYMYVRAAIDHDTALKSANRGLYVNVVLMTAIMLLMLGCATFFANKYLINKIDALQNASRQFAKGNLDVRVSGLVEGGELGELGRTFDAMARSLSEDIAARKQTEMSLLESEAQLQGAVLNSPFPIMLHAEDGEIILLSHSWEEITGYSHEDIPNVFEWTRRAYGNDFESVEKNIKQLFELTHRVDVGENRITTKNGNIRIWDFSSAPIGCLPDGRRLVISMAKDVTEHHGLEEQLVQAQKMEAIGTLAGGVAHDFNNILTVIDGYGAMLQTYVKNDPKALSMLEQILASSHRAGEMTSQLLAFSRKQQLELKTVNLNEIIHGLEKSLRRLIGEHIDCRVHVTMSPLFSVADRSQIEQVIINLAVNARDAMPNGGKLVISSEEIEIDNYSSGIHHIDVQGRFGVITVSDTGSGMSPEIQRKIFDPFFTTKEVGKGTGLGLSMAFGIIKKHNGFINVYSEVENGTVFKMYLPLTENKQSITTECIAELPPSGNECILLAEDDPAILHMLKGLLEDYGYFVYTASDGLAAIQVFLENQESIKMVITDVIMPAKNGREVFEKVTSINPAIPVIFMSGYPAEIMNQENLAGHDINYLTKPINPKTLLKKIRELL